MASNSANEASDSDNENEKATEFFKPGFLLPKKEQEELLKREKKIMTMVKSKKRQLKFLNQDSYFLRNNKKNF